MTINEFTWPDDPDERTVLPLYVSLNEWIALASSVDVGADIAYPQQYVEVFWILVRNLRYSMPICALLIDCIENDLDTQQALATFLANNPLATQALQSLIDNGSLITNQTNPIVQNDDLDALFGAVTFLVDTMHEANVDLFEALEASTNSRETGQIVFEAIPIIETLPFDEISEYIDTIAYAVAENYASQWTTTPITGMRDKLRCGLFCLARANGNSLSWDLIKNYFWNLVGYNVGDAVELLFDFVNFFGSGTWSGDEIVYISFANQATALTVANKFAEMTFPQLATIMQLGQNDPDPDWALVCEDCPVPNIQLIAGTGYPSYTVQFVESEGVYDFYTITAITTGNAATASAVEIDGDPFYVHSVEIVEGTLPENGVLQVGGLNWHDFGAIPCDLATLGVGMYNIPPTFIIKIKIAAFPCNTPTVFLRSRTDGDYGGLTSFTFLGLNGLGQSIYSITSSKSSGANAYGVDTVDSVGGSTLTSAWLVSALVDGVETYYHYHEQADTSGLGDGHSGTRSSKKWSWVSTGDYHQTIIATFSQDPYL